MKKAFTLAIVAVVMYLVYGLCQSTATLQASVDQRHQAYQEILEY